MPQYRCVYDRGVVQADDISSCKLKGKRYVSVVLPTYNEAGNIERLIAALSESLKGHAFEIVVVDDSSTDGTGAIIDRYAKKNVVAVHRSGIRGIFSALMDGIRLSRGEVVVIMDADFSHPPRIVPELVREIKNFDLVSGSRFVSGAGIEAPFSRKFATLALNFACRFLLGTNILDSTGGFHAIKKKKLNEIAFRYPSIWGEFDMELLYVARKKGFKIKEIPFTYKFREEGTSKSSNLLKYGWVYLSRAVQLRLFR